MEASSTDKRIDDLAGQVRRFEGRFERFEDKVDRRFERFEGKIDARFARWDKIVTGGVVSIVGAVIYKVLGF